MIFLIYLPFLLKVFLTLLSSTLRFSRIFYISGRLDSILVLPRDWICAPLFLIESQKDLGGVSFVPIPFLFFLVSVTNILHRRLMRLKFCDALQNQRKILYFKDPSDSFFKAYSSIFGSFKFSFDLQEFDSDSKKPSRLKNSVLLLGIGLYKTWIFARLAMLALKKLPEETQKTVFDLLAALWSAFAIQLLKIRFRLEGFEGVKQFDGPLLIVLNHQSYLDFILAFFALRDLKVDQRPLRLRFLAAKDHFLDSTFVYSILGVGRAIKKAGMIFIDREPQKGWQAIREASQSLVTMPVELAVFPQGTRAKLRKNRDGERIEPGYYTTFTPKTLPNPFGHLRKGVAQLILDTSLLLRNQNRPKLKVLFLGIKGTSKIAPKGFHALKVGQEVSFKFGKVWSVSLPDQVFENPIGKEPKNEQQKNYQVFLEEIQKTIDQELRKVSNQHERLLLSVQESHVWDEKTKAEILFRLKEADAKEETAVFRDLDRILDLPDLEQERALLEWGKTVCR